MSRPQHLTPSAMSIKTTVLEKVSHRTAVISVVGLGYVGLPLAVEFARQGFKVIGIDLDSRKVAAIQAGESYIPDVTTAEVKALTDSGKLSATTDYAVLREADAVSICVPTPRGAGPVVAMMVASAAG